MNPATKGSHLVELDPSAREVLVPKWAHLLLAGQVQERLVIDEKDESILLHVVVKGNFPLGFIILNYEREHTLVCKSFPYYGFCFGAKFQLNDLELAEVGGCDDISFSVVDGIEVDLPMIKMRQSNSLANDREASNRVVTLYLKWTYPRS